MDDRAKFIIRAALIYIQSNLDDVNEVFEVEDGGIISLNGDEGSIITESEVERILMELQ